ERRQAGSRGGAETRRDRIWPTSPTRRRCVVVHGVGELESACMGQARIVVQSLKTGVRKLLIEGGSDARFVPTGHLIYAVGSTLFAVPFDVKKLQTTGGYVPVIEGVRRSRLFPGGTNPATQFGFSNNGSMIYVPGGPILVNGTAATLALVDRTG